MAMRRVSGFKAFRAMTNCRRYTQLHPQSFPCLDKVEQRTQKIKESGPEPSYVQASGYKLFTLQDTLRLDYGRSLDGVNVAYETWGQLNADKSNAILLHTGLSASSHAHSTPQHREPGWWEKFIGPGGCIDTNKYFVICCNVLGGCFGSTGPSSLNPSTGQRYGTHFPIITVHDMVRAQHELINHLGITKLFASVGSSMGGMQSLAYARDFPGSAGRIVSISGCARSHPSSIAMRFVQRQVLMNDPKWNRGFYYDDVPPHVGMKLARQFATVTYRSGPEWEARFARDRLDPSQPPALCPDFLIETYLDHQGEKFCLQYDPNSLLYISKGMDMFDLGSKNSLERQKWRESLVTNAQCPAVPNQPFKEISRQAVAQSTLEDLIEGMAPLDDVPTFVLGVETDSLFPYWQQREIRDVLLALGNKHVQYHELGLQHSLYGHDTFLLDLENVGKPLKAFLES